MLFLILSCISFYDKYSMKIKKHYLWISLKSCNVKSKKSTP